MEENQFDRMNIPTESLTPDMIPGAEASWPEICEFALTFDGYSAIDVVGEIANDIVSQFKKGSPLPADVALLRAALFFEQRRCHHFGSAPEGRERAYVDALLEALRQAIRLDSTPSTKRRPRGANGP